MVHDTSSESLEELLKTASPEMVVEIIREAEKFLESQLISAIAADQRAMTFGGILAAAVALMIGAIVSLSAAGKDIVIALQVIFPVLITSFIALVLAVMTARPVEFWMPGNNPSKWRDDLTKKNTLAGALADQANLYSNGISKNRALMSKNSRLMWWAMWISFFGLVSSAAMTFRDDVGVMVAIRQMF